MEITRKVYENLTSLFKSWRVLGMKSKEYELKIKNKELQSKYNQGLSEIKQIKTRREEIYKRFCQNIDKIRE